MFASRAAFITGAKAVEKGSVYFDGSGDYLSVPTSTGLALGTGDYTIEMWVRPTTSTQQIWFGSPGGTFRNGIAFGMRSGFMWWLSGDGNQWTFERNVGTALTLNQWSHVAVSRINYDSYFYKNGVNQDYQRDTNNLGQGTSWNLGAYVAGYELNGHMSNVRVIKGASIYPYGVGFTPPTAPLSRYEQSGAVTSLLTCQSPTVIADAGTNSLTVTAVGNAAPSSLSPFA